MPYQILNFAENGFALRKLLKILLIILLSFVGLLALISILVNVTPVQNFLVRRITYTLSAQLNTDVHIGHVNFKLFNKFTIDDAYISDQQKDTLLYAEELTVNITNFFFLKNRSILYYVGLKDAEINLNRSPGDSVWNYQFIIEALSSPHPNKQAPLPNIDIRKVNLQNIRVRKKDGWLGQDMFISANRITVDARAIDLNSHSALINQVSLDRPRFVLLRYEATAPRRDSPSLPEADTTLPGTLQWNPDNWKLNVSRLSIQNGGFALIEKGHDTVEKYFDPKHIAFFDINGDLSNIHFQKDSIISQVALSAKERSGLVVKKLHCRFKISPVTLEFSSLDLITNKSHLKNYFSMNFDQFSDLSDFTEKVYMKADFEDAEVSSDDIAFFAPPLKTWKKEIRFNSHIYGTLNNLTGNDLHILAGTSSRFDGHVKLRGLPDINNTFIDLNIERLITTGSDIQKFIPVLKQVPQIDLNSLTSFHFKGSYTGFIYDFVAYGDFSTNLGDVHTDINMKFGQQHKAPVYAGNISAQNFDLGTFLHKEALGPLTFSAKIDGSGLSFDELNATVNGQIDQIRLNGYTYHNIITEGTFNKKLFNGFLQIADPNLGLTFAGNINFNDTLPAFNFQAQVAKSDLRILNLTRDSITFSGKLDLDFSGKDIDHFLGEARLYDINLFKNKTRVAFDTLVINSRHDTRGKLLTFQGNEMQGFLRGQYSFEKLPDAILLFLHHYFPSKVKAPDMTGLKENFSFGFTLGDAEGIIHSFFPYLSGLNDATAKGSINTLADTLTLTADIPRLGYKEYQFNDIHLNALGRTSGLGIETGVGEILHYDSLLLPEANIKIAANQDTAYLNVSTSSTRALNKANLSARVITLNDGYKMKILNSEIVVNDKVWQIAPNNEIVLQKNEVTVNNFNISHNNQRITLTSEKNVKDTAAFLIKLENLSLADFAPFFVPNTLLEGIANATIQVKDPLGKMNITGNLLASEVRVNNDSLGLVHAQVNYNKQQSALSWNVFKNDEPTKNFSLQGLAGLSKKNQALQGNFTLNHTDISVLGTFIKDYVSQLKGYATGQIQLGGTTESPEVTGAVRLDSAGMKVNYLGTYYTFTNETIQFAPQEIDIGSITLHDVNGNTAILRGNIAHDHLSDLRFNITLNTQRFQLMHTTEVENPLYYGNIVATGRVDFTGPLNNMQMVINATPLEGTHIYLPLSDEEDIGKHDFVIFKQYGKELRAVRPEKEKVNLNVRLYANMTPQAKIDVIVDAETGDRIIATGNGALQIDINLDGDFHMYGNYTITEGSYTFSFKGIIARNFAINAGSTISWNGDPTDASIDITAIYSVPGGTSLYNLIAGQTDLSEGGLTKLDQKLMRQREKVDIYLLLKGSLNHPDITYDIRLPEASISAGSFAMTRLQQIRQNPTALLNQVAALLAAGQFIPPTSGVTNSGLLRSSGLSSAGQWVSSQLTGVLNNIFGNTLQNLGLDFSLNYNAYSTTSSNGALYRNDVQFNLSKSLFNNRVEIEVGPSIDWGRSNSPAANNNSYFAGDFRFEYLITPDGRIRFIAFSRSNYDVLLNQNLTRAGVGISYSRQFDRLHELFRSKQERKRLDSIRQARIQKYMEATDSDSLYLPPTTSADSTDL